MSKRSAKLLLEDIIEAIGFRHKLIHGYFGVDYKIVWFVIENELREIKNQCDLILKSLS